MSKHPIKLGNIVFSPIYGIKGVATIFLYQSDSRVCQIKIQPISRDLDKISDGYYIDENLVDYVEDGYTDRLLPLKETHINLGDKVREKISGIVGIVTSRVEMMNGCIDFGLSPLNLNSKGDLIMPILFEESRLELIMTKAELEINEIKAKSLANTVLPVTKEETYKKEEQKTGSCIHKGEHLIRG